QYPRTSLCLDGSDFRFCCHLYLSFEVHTSYSLPLRRINCKAILMAGWSVALKGQVLLIMPTASLTLSITLLPPSASGLASACLLATVGTVGGDEHIHPFEGFVVCSSKLENMSMCLGSHSCAVISLGKGNPE